MSCMTDPCGVIEMVGGSMRTFTFNITDRLGAPFRLGAYSARFALVNIINRSMSPVLTKEMEMVREESGKPTNVLTVTLDAADTYRLRGKYIYQITIVNPTGEADVPHQGEIIIHENIDKSVILPFDETSGGTAAPETPVPVEYDYITSKDIADIFREIDTGSGAALL